MPARVLNPIAEKVRAIVRNGKTSKGDPFTYEIICVATKLRYPTLMNLFSRHNVSYATMKSLEIAGFIDAKDVKSYEDWLEERRGRRRLQKKKRTMRSHGEEI